MWGAPLVLCSAHHGCGVLVVEWPGACTECTPATWRALGQPKYGNMAVTRSKLGRCLHGSQDGTILKHKCTHVSAVMCHNQAMNGQQPCNGFGGGGAPRGAAQLQKPPATLLITMHGSQVGDARSRRQQCCQVLRRSGGLGHALMRATQRSYRCH